MMPPTWGGEADLTGFKKKPVRSVTGTVTLHKRLSKTFSSPFFYFLFILSGKLGSGFFDRRPAGKTMPV
jgi:hypothetical protein